MNEFEKKVEKDLNSFVDKVKLSSFNSFQNSSLVNKTTIEKFDENFRRHS